MALAEIVAISDSCPDLSLRHAHILIAEIIIFDVRFFVCQHPLAKHKPKKSDSQIAQKISRMSETFRPGS